jgi:hypothetical protein
MPDIVTPEPSDAPTAAADAGRPAGTSPHARPPTSGAAMVKGLAPMVVIDVVLPLVTYFVLRGTGMGPFWAYLISGIWPLLKLLVGAVRTRHLDAFSIMILIFIVLGAVTALVTGDVRTLLVRDSITTGGFGLVCLISLLFARPLLFYIGRTFATDGSPAGYAWWDSLWQYPTFRSSQRVITAMWGIAYVAESVLRIVLAYAVDDLDAVVLIMNIVPFVILAGLIFATIKIAMRTRDRGAARRAAADELAAAQADG